MNTHLHPWPAPPCARLFSYIFTLLLLLSASFLTAQIEIVPPAGTSKETTLKLTQPPLTKIEHASGAQPGYLHLFIYGDSKFAIGSSTTNTYEAKHVYVRTNPTGGPSTYHARVYSVGTYTGGDPPPKVKSDPLQTSLPPGTPGDSAQLVVGENQWLNIQRNAKVVPGDTVVHIVSIKNPGDEPATGVLLFLYNGPLIQHDKDSNGKPVATATKWLLNLQHEESLIYNSNIDRNAYWYNNLPPTFKNKYNNVLAYSFNDLPPGEEQRVFIDMSIDKTISGNIDAKLQYTTDIVALLYTDSGELLATPGEQDTIAPLNLPELLSQINSKPANQVLIYSPSIDTSVIDTQQQVLPNASDVGLRDVFIFPAEVSLSHDPNYIKAVACACPDEFAEYNKVLFTVRCENDGYGMAKNIFMDVLLPDGIDANMVFDTAITYHPYNPNSTNMVELEILDDHTIRWRMEGFWLSGTPEYGVGHPNTYAEINFVAFTKQDPNTLGDIQAMIRFGTDTSDPVYTDKAKIIGVSEAIVGANSLVCGPCQEITSTPGFCDSFWCLFAWWVWLLIILGLLLLIWLLYRVFS